MRTPGLVGIFFINVQIKKKPLEKKKGKLTGKFENWRETENDFTQPFLYDLEDYK